jgi:hypothetical protein
MKRLGDLLTAFGEPPPIDMEERLHGLPTASATNTKEVEMHAYIVTVRTESGMKEYNAVAHSWWECFEAASKEFGIRRIGVRPA